MSQLKDADLNFTGLTLDGCGRCSTCLTVKPAADFYQDKSRTCGLGSRCINCEAARSRDNSARNRARAVQKAARRSLVDDLIALAKRHPLYEGLLGDTAVALAV